MDFSRKLRNKMGGRCAKSGWLVGFGNRVWRWGGWLACYLE